VRLNAIAPAAVDSTCMVAWAEERRKASAGKAPLKRRCKPADLAEVMVFLLAGAAMVTGQTVVVDGGLTLEGRWSDGLRRQAAERARHHGERREALEVIRIAERHAQQRARLAAQMEFRALVGLEQRDGVDALGLTRGIRQVGHFRPLRHRSRDLRHPNESVGGIAIRLRRGLPRRILRRSMVRKPKGPP
jgi:hypothetical protein